ncbi:DUF1694 domain-containing protein [Leuconostoc rapi]|uniref:DUF1694 domain-containing protein n=1 Tax=Leuconostoc rapi TaxID=1406906 RepID=UPI00195CAE3D|nr:DUF1694 domain-containing protein [Leuconostoc rapi]MBM7435852.1 uncharacterized protein YueI [Leuconostoc rapi]
MDINERIQQDQRGGHSQINPDEQRHYLGTFRERVIVAVKASQLNNAQIQAKFEAALRSHSIGKVLINQQLAEDNFTTYVTIATRTKHPFTLLSHADESSQEDDPIAVLLAADTAINIDHIYLS